MPPVIRVSNLGKEYIIGAREKQAYQTFREMLTQALAAPFQRLRTLGGDATDEERFWALKDVSFEVHQGEVVGIIGRNGAGKSTLLKILSRITDPTEGEVEVRGRVASLLEVGTGFHPELTGRENIYLNGAILGMSRAEITRKLDEIVAFSEVERFLDTPVKRYSSGMSVRLAFAVAAHLEPEILIVDEVLAVGDVGFQKKCLGKMGDISVEGRTVLFVSHNLSALRALCSRGILLTHGKIDTLGDADTVIDAYSVLVKADTSVSIANRSDRSGSGNAKIINVEITEPSDGRLPSCGSSLTYEITFECRKIINGLNVYFGVYDVNNSEVIHINSEISGHVFPSVFNRITIKLGIPRLSLTPGCYRIDVGILNGCEILDLVRGADVLQVIYGDYFGSKCLGSYRGLLLLDHYWQLKDEN
jgi:lipopolysaccharide transport system ATP-binding protein